MRRCRGLGILQSILEIVDFAAGPLPHAALCRKYAALRRFLAMALGAPAARLLISSLRWSAASRPNQPEAERGAEAGGREAARPKARLPIHAELHRPRPTRRLRLSGAPLRSSPQLLRFRSPSTHIQRRQPHRRTTASPLLTCSLPAPCLPHPCNHSRIRPPPPTPISHPHSPSHPCVWFLTSRTRRGWEVKQHTQPPGKVGRAHPPDALSETQSRTNPPTRQPPPKEGALALRGTRDGHAGMMAGLGNTPGEHAPYEVVVPFSKMASIKGFR